MKKWKENPPTKKGRVIEMKVSNNYLLKFLSNEQAMFVIPPYQRNYEWELEQCSAFFENIMETAKKNLQQEVTEHFVGTIVYTANPSIEQKGVEKYIIIDGQQRITTSMLFLAAIRDVIETEEYKKKIDSVYLKNDAQIDNKNDYKIKLKQVEADWESYRRIMLGLQLTKEHEQSAVFRNYSYFVRKIRELKKEGFPLKEMFQKGLGKFNVVLVELEPEKKHWENPQEIFETMNSLGKPLSLADLIRNYLLLGKETTVQEYLYKTYWVAIEKRLPNELSNFMRDFMQLVAQRSFKKANEKNNKELYAEFKVRFSKEDSQETIKELEKYSSYYASISLGSLSGNEKIDHKLNDIRTIGMTTTYSFLLGLFEHWKLEDFNASELEDVLDVLFIYGLRRRILGLTRAENNSFPQLISRISEIVEDEDKRATMFNILAKQDYELRLPDNEELGGWLSKMNFYNFRNNKFILSLVEEKLTNKRPDKEDKFLQVEHIMPQMLSDVWKHDLGNDFDTTYRNYVNNIGNLTLIRHNQELGNKSFRAKKDIYENKSGLQIAKEQIINQEKWEEESILNRREWIVGFILDEVVPIPNDMKEANNFSGKKILDGSQMKPGEFAQKVIRVILGSGKVSNWEVLKLQEKRYSTDTLKVSLPFLTGSLTEKTRTRYYKEPIVIRGEKYYMNSQLTPIQLPYLQRWAQEHGGVENARERNDSIIEDYYSNQSMDMKKQFQNFLVATGKSEATAYIYANTVDKIRKAEMMDWESFVQNIFALISDYDIGGWKEEVGMQGNRTYINALKRFGEFVRAEIN